MNPKHPIPIKVKEKHIRKKRKPNKTEEKNVRNNGRNVPINEECESPPSA